MRFTGGVRGSGAEKERRKREGWMGKSGRGGGVYLAQKASNFQRGCKNGVGTRSGRYTRAGCWVYKTPLSFFTSYLDAPEGVVLTPLSCFPSFPAFLFSAAGKLSADPPSSVSSHCGTGYTRATFSSFFHSSLLHPPTVVVLLSFYTAPPATRPVRPRFLSRPHDYPPFHRDCVHTWPSSFRPECYPTSNPRWPNGTPSHLFTGSCRDRRGETKCS